MEEKRERETYVSESQVTSLMTPEEANCKCGSSDRAEVAGVTNCFEGVAVVASSVQEPAGAAKVEVKSAADAIRMDENCILKIGLLRLG